MLYRHVTRNVTRAETLSLILVNEVSLAPWRKSTPSMCPNWKVKMFTPAAVLCVTEHLKATDRLLLSLMRLGLQFDGFEFFFFARAVTEGNESTNLSLQQILFVIFHNWLLLFFFFSWGEKFKPFQINEWQMKEVSLKNKTAMIAFLNWHPLKKL